MSKADADAGGRPRDHRELVDWVAITKKKGSDRRLHRVEGEPGPEDLELNEAVETACQTTLTSGESTWIAKPAAVYPPGYKELCDHAACFGGPDDAGDRDADADSDADVEIDVDAAVLTDGGADGQH